MKSNILKLAIIPIIILVIVSVNNKNYQINEEVVAATIATKAEGGDRVFFLDTVIKSSGRYEGSDAIVLESNGKYAMIDTARGATKTKVLRYLKKIGATNLEFLLITHAHEDHIGGIDYIMKNGIKINKLYIKDLSNGQSDSKYKNRVKNVIKNAEKRGITVCDVTTGTYTGETLGNFSFSFYNTENRARFSNFDENTNSIAVLANINGKKIYFAGDLNEKKGVNAERECAAQVGKVDFYKVAHHSYDFNNVQAALEIIKPSYGVVTNHRERENTSMARQRILQYTNITNDTLYYVADGTVMLTIQPDGTFDIQQFDLDSIDSIPNSVSGETNGWNTGTTGEVDQRLVESLRYACSFIGKIKYADKNDKRRFGKLEEGYSDCSHFVHRVFEHTGIMKKFVHSEDWGVGGCPRTKVVAEFKAGKKWDYSNASPRRYTLGTLSQRK